jgi:hypothetical protein
MKSTIDLIIPVDRSPDGDHATDIAEIEVWWDAVGIEKRITIHNAKWVKGDYFSPYDFFSLRGEIMETLSRKVK